MPGIYAAGTPSYFEVELKDGDVAYRSIAPPRSTGIAAVKDVLGTFELRHGELARGFDRVLGPAIRAMNDFRLAKSCQSSAMEFGRQFHMTRSSIIIPLHRRIDFMEYQLAFFSRTLAASHEIIYVLDDPAAKREAAELAQSCFERFARPFKLVCLSQNVGYAPANNIGLRYACGEFVCFLNSDVFPREPDWLEYMLEMAANHPEAGIVGALLLFEDGTVQHEGCVFRNRPELGGWSFSLHPNKGRCPSADKTPTIAEAVTGACLVMSRQLATELGGFDEGYIIGDFEDADLCLRVRSKGLRCLVDRRAELYHLERQSQDDPGQVWRTNLTLYNAWLFHQRWGVGDAAAVAASKQMDATPLGAVA